MEDIRRCKKRGSFGLSWTSARQALVNTVALGGGRGDETDCAGVGFGAIRAAAFLPVEALEVIKPWHAAAELASSMTLKSWWVQNP